MLIAFTGAKQGAKTYLLQRFLKNFSVTTFVLFKYLEIQRYLLDAKLMKNYWTSRWTTYFLKLRLIFHGIHIQAVKMKRTVTYFHDVQPGEKHSSKDVITNKL